jgi:hypothetical protein
LARRERLFGAIDSWIRLSLKEEVSGILKQQVPTDSESWLWRYRVAKFDLIHGLTRAYWRDVHTGVAPLTLTSSFNDSQIETGAENQVMKLQTRKASPLYPRVLD